MNFLMFEEIIRLSVSAITSFEDAFERLFAGVYSEMTFEVLWKMNLNQ